MRYLIISDMHGNADALAAVLRKVRRKRFDATLMLGDMVGYGAAPNQVVEAVRALPGRVYRVRGNHDKVVTGVEDGANFNEEALAAARWTTEHLDRRNLRYVRELREGPLQVTPELAICHGSPIDEDMYLFSEVDALAAFCTFPARVTFFGHTHLPSAFILHSSGVKGVLLGGPRGRIRIQDGFRYLINPGSVGQPRDRNPMAAYMVYDTSRSLVTWFRLPYPIDLAQRRIHDAGLPGRLADRLSYGI